MKHFYDHHIHLGYGNFRKKNRSDKFLNTPLDNPYNNLLEYQNSGITTLKDGGDKNMLAFQLREEAKEMGITLYSTGRALTKKGCYGKRLGMPLSSMDDLKQELDFLIGQGVDCIKVIQSGLVEMNGSPQKEYGCFTEEELLYIRETTKSCQLPVMVHVNFPKNIRLVAEVGMDSVEHGYFMDEATLKVMAKNNVAWTPTLAVFANVVTYGSIIEGWDTNIIKTVVEQHKNKIKLAHSLGVTILLGSDSGSSIVPHGRGTRDEYDLLKNLLGEDFIYTDKK